MTTPTPDGNCAKLLHDVAVELKALEQARERYSPQLAPDFSIFDYVDTSELGLSRILGDLLNPKGKHGQKDLFLRCFIERCLPNLDDNGWQEFKDNLSKTKIKLEERTWQYQSIDGWLFIGCNPQNLASVSKTSRILLIKNSNLRIMRWN